MPSRFLGFGMQGSVMVMVLLLGSLFFAVLPTVRATYSKQKFLMAMVGVSGAWVLLTVFNLMYGSRQKKQTRCPPFSPERSVAFFVQALTMATVLGVSIMELTSDGAMERFLAGERL